MIRPSAQAATERAVSTLTAAPMSSGGWSGRVQSRARSTVTRPSWLTSSPASSARMTSTHSRSRSARTSLRGQPSPVMCSLDASPVPSATQNRPGNIAAESGDRLGDDRRVVALAGRIDDAEGQAGPSQSGAQPRPCEPGMSLPGAPGRKVVRAHGSGEPSLFGGDHCVQKLAWMDLFVGSVKADDGHADLPTQPGRNRRPGL